MDRLGECSRNGYGHRHLRRLGPALMAAALLTGCAARTAVTLPSSVRAGADIVVVWDCLPQWGPEIVGQIVGVPGQLGPCYGERLTIRAVLGGGWVEGIDRTDGSVWLVNLQRAMAVQPAQRSIRAD